MVHPRHETPKLPALSRHDCVQTGDNKPRHPAGLLQDQALLSNAAPPWQSMWYCSKAVATQAPQLHVGRPPCTSLPAGARQEHVTFAPRAGCFPAARLPWFPPRAGAWLWRSSRRARPTVRSPCVGPCPTARPLLWPLVATAPHAGCAPTVRLLWCLNQGRVVAMVPLTWGPALLQGSLRRGPCPTARLPS